MAKKPNADQQTLALITDVKNRKAEIAKALGKSNYLTNCTFSYVDGKLNDAINIHVQTDVKTLVSIVAFLKERERGYLEAGTLLGVENLPNFMWNGYSVADWTEDVKTRLAKVQVAVKQKKLESLEARLNLIISPELRAQMELEAIAQELN